MADHLQKNKLPQMSIKQKDLHLQVFLFDYFIPINRAERFLLPCAT